MYPLHQCKKRVLKLQKEDTLAYSSRASMTTRHAWVRSMSIDRKAGHYRCKQKMVSFKGRLVGRGGVSPQ